MRFHKLPYWSLRSCTVEEKLFSHYKNTETPMLIAGCSLVLDFEDTEIMGLFKPDEWEDIAASIPLLPDPNLSDTHQAYLDRLLGISTLNDLISFTFDVGAQAHDDEFVYWISQLCYRMIPLYKHNLFLEDQHESFFSHRLWQPVIDTSFEPYFSVFRGEIPSNASHMRINSRRQTRKTTSHDIINVKPANQYDVIFRQRGGGGINTFEYGASECARHFGGQYSPKWRADRNRLAIQLRDQLVHLNKGTGGRSSVLRGAQLIGFLTAGTMYQSFRLCCPVGNVCIFVPGPILEFPRLVSDFGHTVAIIDDILRCRSIMLDTQRLVREPHRQPPTEIEFLGLSWTEEF